MNQCFYTDVRNKNGETKSDDKKKEDLLVQIFLQYAKANNNDPHQMRKAYSQCQEHSQPFEKIRREPVKRKSEECIDEGK